MGLRTPDLTQATQQLEDIEKSAAATATAPLADTTRQVARQAAAGSGLGAALEEVGAAPADAEQAVLQQEQLQQTQLVRQQAAQARQALLQTKSELDRKTAREFEFMSEQQAAQVEDYRTKALGILSQLSQGRERLSLAQQKAKTEQVGFLLRQSSKEYIDSLQREGKKRRLDTSAGFRQALLEQQFDDEKDLLHSDLSFRRALTADRREFEKWVANMDLDTAFSMALGETQEAARAARYSAASSFGSAAIQYGAQSLAERPTTATPAASAPAAPASQEPAGWDAERAALQTEQDLAE